jgi:hypothetical protein
MIRRIIVDLLLAAALICGAVSVLQEWWHDRVAS